MKGKGFAIALSIVVLTIDILTKIFTKEYLPLMNDSVPVYPYGGIGAFKDFFGIEFSLVHQVNYGAAWGLFAQYQTHLLVLRLTLVAALIVYFFFFNKNRQIAVPLALVIAGASGNIIDYFVYGHVVDMFHFVLWGYDYPVFNVADSAICIGIFWLFIYTFFHPPKDIKTT